MHRLTDRLHDKNNHERYIEASELLVFQQAKLHTPQNGTAKNTHLRLLQIKLDGFRIALSECRNSFQISENKSKENQDKMEIENARLCLAFRLLH